MPLPPALRTLDTVPEGQRVERAMPADDDSGGLRQAGRSDD
jgi:hypothetical protein